MCASSQYRVRLVPYIQRMMYRYLCNPFLCRSILYADIKVIPTYRTSTHAFAFKVYIVYDIGLSHAAFRPATAVRSRRRLHVHHRFTVRYRSLNRTRDRALAPRRSPRTRSACYRPIARECSSQPPQYRALDLAEQPCCVPILQST